MQSEWEDDNWRDVNRGALDGPQVHEAGFLPSAHTGLSDSGCTAYSDYIRGVKFRESGARQQN